MATNVLPAAPEGHAPHLGGWPRHRHPDNLQGTMAAPSTPPRVLIIDDDPMSRDLLGLLLEGEGYTIQTAESGDAALTLLQQRQPLYDAILTDLHMPGITTEELAHRLRQTCGAACFLLAISGTQPQPDVVSLFDGFLLKPFRTEQVTAAVSAHRTRVQLRTQGEPRKSPRKRASTSQRASKKAMNTPHAAPGVTHDEPVTEAPILNETIYGQLARSLPIPQLKEMYAMCLNDARRRIAGMRTSAAEHDSAAFIREAHAIKGGCGMLGATELHRLAAELETHGLASSGRTTEDVNSLDELSAACDRLERMLGSRA
jgi:CheY-like chemotaxis protein/HPt (histidine-containing phosphotransfer) domain-containing protein